jgi:hypothetical protein
MPTDGGEEGDGGGDNEPEEKPPEEKPPEDSLKKHTLHDSLQKVLGIDENTTKGTKTLKHLLHALTAFGHGFVGKDDPLMQAAIADFRAKRDAGIAEDKAILDAKIAAEAKTREQDELVKNYMKYYPWLTTDQAWSMVADYGNAYSGQLAHDRAKELLSLQFGNELKSKEIDHRHALILQDRNFNQQTSMLDKATQNNLALMYAAAGISAEQAPRATIEMARLANAYNEATGEIDSEKLGNFINKSNGQTWGKAAQDVLKTLPTLLPGVK